MGKYHKKGTHKAWTPDDVEKLKDLSQKGVATAIQMVILDRTRDSITSKRRKLKLKPMLSTRSALLDHLGRGGRVVLDVYPKIGRIWSDATRNGVRFPTQDCDELVSSSVLQKDPQGNAVWALNPAKPRWNEL